MLPRAYFLAKQNATNMGHFLKTFLHKSDSNVLMLCKRICSALTSSTSSDPSTNVRMLRRASSGVMASPHAVAPAKLYVLTALSGGAMRDLKTIYGHLGLAVSLHLAITQ